MTPHRTRRAALSAYRRFLARLEADATRYAEIAFEHQADLAAHLPPEEELDGQLVGETADLLTDLWGGIDDLTDKLAGVIAFARQARGLRRPQRPGTAPESHTIWKGLREAAARRAELRAPEVAPNTEENDPMPAAIPPPKLETATAESRAIHA